MAELGGGLSATTAAGSAAVGTQIAAAIDDLETSLPGSYLTLPAPGTTAGFVPTVQPDGSMAYAVGGGGAAAKTVGTVVTS